MPRVQTRPSPVAALWRSNRRIARTVWRLSAAAGAAAAAGLVLLHAWIFWDRLSSGQILEADSAIRWAGGALLVGALVALRRQGLSLTWGRPALTTWLLVALLHAGAAGSGAAAEPAAPSPASAPATAAFLVPLVTTLAALGGLLLLRRALTGRRHASSLVRPAVVLTSRDRSAAVRVPRAPPALAC